MEIAKIARHVQQRELYGSLVYEERRLRGVTFQFPQKKRELWNTVNDISCLSSKFKVLNSVVHNIACNTKSLHNSEVQCMACNRGS